MDDEGYLIFLSHKVEVRKKVQSLKEGLEFYGVEAFVAHSDIEPGTEWQETILAALGDMDAFVPILTKGFPDSPWTDQEVGYAIASEVPIIPLRIGLDPYGFMGKYQALSCSWDDAPTEIIKALTDDSRLVDAFIDAVSDCPDYAAANRLSAILPSIESLTPAQATRFVSIFNENLQVGGSYGFNGTNPSAHGHGLPALLRHVTGRDVHLSKDWQDRFRIQPTWFGTYEIFR